MGWDSLGFILSSSLKRGCIDVPSRQWKSQGLGGKRIKDKQHLISLLWRGQQEGWDITTTGDCAWEKEKGMYRKREVMQKAKAEKGGMQGESKEKVVMLLLSEAWCCQDGLKCESCTMIYFVSYITCYKHWVVSVLNFAWAFQILLLDMQECSRLHKKWNLDTTAANKQRYLDVFAT